MTLSLTCPILHTKIEDPALTIYGNVYERSAIAQWFSQHDTDPVTNMRVPTKMLYSLCNAETTEEIHTRILEVRSFIRFYYKYDKNDALKRADEDFSLYGFQIPKIISLLVWTSFRDNQLWNYSLYQTIQSRFGIRVSDDYNIARHVFSGRDLTNYTVPHIDRQFKNFAFHNTTFGAQKFYRCVFNLCSFQRSDLRNSLFQNCTLVLDNTKDYYIFSEALIDWTTMFLNCNIKILGRRENEGVVSFYDEVVSRGAKLL